MPALLDRRARAFLERHRVARLATASAAGVPHVVPLCYARVGGAVYFVVDAKPKHPGGLALKRMRNIAENPRVALVVDDYGEDWTALAFLLIHGEAAVVGNGRERTRVLAALRVRYPQYRSMGLEGPEHPVVRLTPTHVHFWQASAPTPRAGAGRSATRGGGRRRRTSPLPRSPRRPR